MNNHAHMNCIVRWLYRYCATVGRWGGPTISESNLNVFNVNILASSNPPFRRYISIYLLLKTYRNKLFRIYKLLH